MNERIQRIRQIVFEDYNRITHASNPFDVLNATASEKLEQLEERYERYERFYRAENFQRLGDIDLTRKALEIRRSLGRAVVDARNIIKAKGRAMGAKPAHDELLFEDADDLLAMSEIYLRDGITYLQLGDINEARTLLSRSVKYNPNRGIALAYLGYVTFKRRHYDASSIDEARELLEQASTISPSDPDVFILRGRFFAKMKERTALRETILHIESINPAHPMLDRLQRRLHELTD